MAYENLFTGRLVLFDNNDKKSEKSPDFGGNIEFTLSDAMALTEWITAQEGEENYAGEKVVKIPVSAWNRMSKKWFIFCIRVNLCIKRRKRRNAFLTWQKLLKKVSNPKLPPNVKVFQRPPLTWSWVLWSRLVWL